MAGRKMGSKDANPGGQERRAERMPLDEAARLRPNDWSSMEIRMIDLSAAGFRAQCDALLKAGGSVSLEVPGIGPVEAQVEWRRGDMSGARFFQPIDLSRCGWSPSERGSALAQLLIDRAKANSAGNPDVERRLRQQILAALPMRKGSLSA
jgi:hypothetical protein